MTKAIDANATMMCPHAGQVQATPSITRVTMAGAAPLAQDDTFLVSGCPFNVSGAPQPCTEVEWVTAATRVTCEGKKILLEDSTGLCKAAGAPQGSANVVVTQQRVTAK